MTAPFDPYHKWLGIPPAQQPPTHYRLLGLEPFEADPDVIDAAANQRMAYLQDLAVGDRVKESQKLLNEVATARRTLLNKDKKSEYDNGLRAAQAPAPVPVVAAPVPPPEPVAAPVPAPAPAAPAVVSESAWGDFPAPAVAAPTAPPPEPVPAANPWADFSAPTPAAPVYTPPQPAVFIPPAQPVNAPPQPAYPAAAPVYTPPQPAYPAAPPAFAAPVAPAYAPPAQPGYAAPIPDAIPDAMIPDAVAAEPAEAADDFGFGGGGGPTAVRPAPRAKAAKPAEAEGGGKSKKWLIIGGAAGLLGLGGAAAAAVLLLGGSPAEPTEAAAPTKPKGRTVAQAPAGPNVPRRAVPRHVAAALANDKAKRDGGKPLTGGLSVPVSDNYALDGKFEVPPGETVKIEFGPTVVTLNGADGSVTVEGGGDREDVANVLPDGARTFQFTAIVEQAFLDLRVNDGWVVWNKAFPAAPPTGVPVKITGKDAKVVSLRYVSFAEGPAPKPAPAPAATPPKPATPPATKPAEKKPAAPSPQKKAAEDAVKKADDAVKKANEAKAKADQARKKADDDLKKADAAAKAAADDADKAAAAKKAADDKKKADDAFKKADDAAKKAVEDKKKADEALKKLAGS